MKKISLKIAQHGTACAPAFCIKKIVSDIRPSSGVENEIRTFKEAASKLKDELLQAATLATEENRPIIEAEMMMLDDPSFAGKAYSLIQNENLSASEAVFKAGAALSKQFSEHESDYIKGRADDITGLVKELIEIMNGKEREDLDVPSILVAEDISPALFSRFDHQMICGIVTEKGSSTSHLSILAENLGIPYIYGLFEEMTGITNGQKLIIDDGDLIIDPDEETIRSILEKSENSAKENQSFSQGKIKTLTAVYANAGSVEDIEKAVQKGAGGIGLLRTEFLFIERNDEPSEEEQLISIKKPSNLWQEKRSSSVRWI